MTIYKNTVLVLGAGASKPYGYPLGSELREMLVSPSHFQDLCRFGILTQNDVEHFCNGFLLSGTRSIDSYLSSRGKDLLPSGISIEKIGKAGISLALRMKQHLHKLFHHPSLKVDEHSGIDQHDHWYELLWDALTRGLNRSTIEGFKENRLTVVTFNYDLSLEHYLYWAMRSRYNLSNEKASELLNAGVKFIHVYGQLAGDPCSEQFFYSFDVDTMAHQRLISADIRSIKVIDDDRVDESIFERVQEILIGSDQIAVLGFGYDSTNMARLKLEKVIEERARQNYIRHQDDWPKWLFSTMGMVGVERAQLKSQLLGKLHSGGFRDETKGMTPDGAQNWLSSWRRDISTAVLDSNQKTLITLRESGFLL